MIVEAKPLHKKKKRLRRQQTLLTQQASIGADDLPEANVGNDFGLLAPSQAQSQVLSGFKFPRSVLGLPQLQS